MNIPPAIISISGGTNDLYTLDAHWRDVATVSAQMLSIMNMCTAKLYRMDMMKLCTTENEKFSDMMSNVFAIKAPEIQTIMGYSDSSGSQNTLSHYPPSGPTPCAVVNDILTCYGVKY